jgi:hypothetical protein
MVVRYLVHHPLGRDRENSSISTGFIGIRGQATSSGSELSFTRQCLFEEESSIKMTQ